MIEINDIKNLQNELARIHLEEEEKYMPIWRLILIDLEKIKEPEDKLNFLKKEGIKYLQNLSPISMAASGVTSYFAAGEQFLDRKITLKMREIMDENNIEGQIDSFLHLNLNRKAKIVKYNPELWNTFKISTPNQMTIMERIFNQLKQNSENIIFISQDVKWGSFKKLFNGNWSA